MKKNQSSIAPNAPESKKSLTLPHIFVVFTAFAEPALSFQRINVDDQDKIAAIAANPPPLPWNKALLPLT